MCVFVGVCLCVCMFVCVCGGKKQIKLESIWHHISVTNKHSLSHKSILADWPSKKRKTILAKQQQYMFWSPRTDKRRNDRKNPRKIKEKHLGWSVMPENQTAGCRSANRLQYRVRKMSTLYLPRRKNSCSKYVGWSYTHYENVSGFTRQHSEGSACK